jgi:hypothetical protein
MQRQQMADALFHGPITLLRENIMLCEGRFETASRLVGD